MEKYSLDVYYNEKFKQFEIKCVSENGWVLSELQFANLSSKLCELLEGKIEFDKTCEFSDLIPGSKFELKIDHDGAMVLVHNWFGNKRMSMEFGHEAELLFFLRSATCQLASVERKRRPGNVGPLAVVFPSGDKYGSKAVSLHTDSKAPVKKFGVLFKDWGQMKTFIDLTEWLVAKDADELGNLKYDVVDCAYQIIDVTIDKENVTIRTLNKNKCLSDDLYVQVRCEDVKKGKLRKAFASATGLYSMMLVDHKKQAEFDIDNMPIDCSGVASRYEDWIPKLIRDAAINKIEPKAMIVPLKKRPLKQIKSAADCDKGDGDESQKTDEDHDCSDNDGESDSDDGSLPKLGYLKGRVPNPQPIYGPDWTLEEIEEREMWAFYDPTKIAGTQKFKKRKKTDSPESP